MAVLLGNCTQSVAELPYILLTGVFFIIGFRKDHLKLNNESNVILTDYHTYYEGFLLPQSVWTHKLQYSSAAVFINSNKYSLFDLKYTVVTFTNSICKCFLLAAFSVKINSSFSL